MILDRAMFQWQLHLGLWDCFGRSTRLPKHFTNPMMDSTTERPSIAEAPPNTEAPSTTGVPPATSGGETGASTSSVSTNDIESGWRYDEHMQRRAERAEQAIMAEPVPGDGPLVDPSLASIPPLTISDTLESDPEHAHVKPASGGHVGDEHHVLPPPPGLTLDGSTTSPVAPNGSTEAKVFPPPSMTLDDPAASGVPTTPGSVMVAPPPETSLAEKAEPNADMTQHVGTLPGPGPHDHGGVPPSPKAHEIPPPSEAFLKEFDRMREPAKLQPLMDRLAKMDDMEIGTKINELNDHPSMHGFVAYLRTIFGDSYMFGSVNPLEEIAAFEQWCKAEKTMVVPAPETPQMPAVLAVLNRATTVDLVPPATPASAKPPDVKHEAAPEPHPDQAQAVSSAVLEGK